VTCNGFVYNVDAVICRADNPLDLIVADQCQCIGCRERKLAATDHEDDPKDG
jgi:hypothetical protein